MGALRLTPRVLVIVAMAGCGVDASPPQLVDGSTPRDPPPALTEVDGGVMTRARVVSADDVGAGKLKACRPDARPYGGILERVGVRGQSLTFQSGKALIACDAISEPAADPDDPYGGIWCGSSTGRLDGGRLNDPRLDLCTAESGDVTAFAWVQPGPDAAWVVVADGGRHEVYEVVESLPVRITATDRVDPSGSASFEVEEYDADATKLQEYTLDTVVAG